jgi:hypothetical protein
MTEKVFRGFLIFAALAFTAVFSVVVAPPLFANPDILGAFAAGFVNPYASGYSTDVLFCWGILVAWVLFEAKTLEVRHGWICLALGIVPGVAVGFAFYLLLRHGQVSQSPVDKRKDC